MLPVLPSSSLVTRTLKGFKSQEMRDSMCGVGMTFVSAAVRSLVSVELMSPFYLYCLLGGSLEPFHFMISTS